MKTFLRADWRYLAISNFVIDPEIIAPMIPKGTELDLWNDTCFVSLVGFRFLNTRLRGFRIPFHTDFTEVNLRFYVRYKAQSEWRRGVTFIREIVGLPALAFVANRVYGEKYETMPVAHAWQIDADHLHVEYRWKKGGWNTFGVTAEAKAIELEHGSKEEFITEHYWGYTQHQPASTYEYGVEHPRWRMHPLTNYQINVDFGKVYGKEFGFLNDQAPDSVMLAEGSEITVKEKRGLTP